MARALSSTVFCALHFLTLRRYVPMFSFWRAAWRPVVATVGMTVGVLFLRTFTFWGAMAGGVVLYAGLAWWWVADARERESFRMAWRAAAAGRAGTGARANDEL